MKQAAKSWATLADVEREVVAEYREWGRQRLAQRLYALADQTGEDFPLRQRQRRPLMLRTELGWVTLTVGYGQVPQPLKWVCPQQRAWGLSPHQKLTLGLAEKLCFTAVATTSYEPAAAVAAGWGVLAGACRPRRGGAAWAKPRASMWWPTGACGFGSLWRIAWLPPRAGWIFTPPASTSGNRRTRCIRKTQPGRRRGANRAGTSCGTAAKRPGGQPCRTCPPGVRNGSNRGPRWWPKKPITLSIIARLFITRRGRRKAVRSAAGPWNPCAGNSKAGSNAAASSGPNRGGDD